MIRCSHCGKLAPTGALSCQNCGMPLVSGGGISTGTGQSEEALPAWLESLRAHERPVLSGQENRQPFSPDELVDENSMPSWMRQDRRKAPENGNSDSFPALPVMPGAGQQNTPTSGFQAGSLIDERSLPTWMRENQGGEQGATAQNVQAHSLVDQQALPSWIKDLGQTGPSQTTGAQYYGLSAQPQTPPTGNAYGLSAQPQMPSMNQYGLPAQTPVTPPTMSSAPRIPQTPPAHEPPQSFSAHDLLDMQSMPGWMSGAQGPGAPPPTRPVPIGQGFSAGELVDQRSVPSWMKDLQGPGKTDPQSAMGVPVSGSGQMMGMGQGTTGGEGMPAGSLLDANSMPGWMQNNGQNAAPAAPGQGIAAGSLLDANSMPGWMQNNGQNAAPAAPGQGIAAGSLLDANSMPGWMQNNGQNAAPAAPGQGMAAGSLLDMSSMPAWMREGEQNSPQGSQSGAQGMAAGSLIDMNSMPAWMRNAESSQSGPNTSGRLGQVPIRPVPSRPRNEIASQDQSEVAANVFASMLGVAASAPALPGQDYVPANNLGVAQGTALPPLQPSIPGWQQPQQAPPTMNQYNQGALPHTWQMSGPIPSINQPPMANAALSAGQQPGASSMSPRANNTESPAWAAFASADKTAWGANSGMNGESNNAGGNQTAEAKKKGFFDSIRDFFFK